MSSDLENDCLALLIRDELQARRHVRTQRLLAQCQPTRENLAMSMEAMETLDELQILLLVYVPTTHSEAIYALRAA